ERGHRLDAATAVLPTTTLLLVLRDRARELFGVAPEVLLFDRLLVVGALDLLPEDLRHDLGGDARDHVDEERVALLLVLLLRILLAVAAETDAVAQVIHLGQVLDPRAVELLEVDVPENAQEELRPELLLALEERLLRALVEVLREQLRVADVVDLV